MVLDTTHCQKPPAATAAAAAPAQSPSAPASLQSPQQTGNDENGRRVTEAHQRLRFLGGTSPHPRERCRPGLGSAKGIHPEGLEGNCVENSVRTTPASNWPSPSRSLSSLAGNRLLYNITIKTADKLLPMRGSSQEEAHQGDAQSLSTQRAH